MYQASQGLAYSLSLLKWDIFATPTFRNPVPPERVGWALVWRHLHRVSEMLGVPYGVLLIALRSEHGELNDRFHFHYLLGRTRSSNLHTTAHQVAYDWHKATGGHLECRVYDSALAGSDYIEGCLGGANLYEIGKYNRADKLELSASVVRLVKRATRTIRREDSTARHHEKTGECRTPSMAAPVTEPCRARVSVGLRHEPAQQWHQVEPGLFAVA